MREYHKINGLWKRDDRGKVLWGQFARPEFEYLLHNSWNWTEKIDGMNIRVHWVLDHVTFGGRSDKAQIPGKLSQNLVDTFTAEKLGTVFETGPVVTLYGEGYGPGIQGGGHYRDDQGFILFDVQVEDLWLNRESLEDIATKLGIPLVPQLDPMSLYDMHSLYLWKGEIFGQAGHGLYEAEGAVGTPTVPLRNRAGQRIIVKVKRKDYAT